MHSLNRAYRALTYTEPLRAFNTRGFKTPCVFLFLKKGEKIMAKKDVIDDLITDIEHYCSNIAKYAAIEAREDLYKTAQNAIDYFYDEWQPTYYERHYYNLKEKSFKKYYHNNHNKTYSGGIELSYEWMDDIYRADTELIFNLVYAGYHGLKNVNWRDEDGNITSIGTPVIMHPFTPYHITSPSPMEIIEEKQRKILRNPEHYLRVGMKKAGSETYKVL